MKVNLERSPVWKDIIEISKVEKRYKCKYVCETCLNVKGLWREHSSLIFYNEVAHPEGSNYMALSYQLDGDDGYLVVSDGISVTEEPIVGIIDGDEVIYSRFRHDYRVGKTGVMIDGGRDYIRSSIADPDKYVNLVIREGVLGVE
jgi:hypothetical protein